MRRGQKDLLRQLVAALTAPRRPDPQRDMVAHLAACRARAWVAYQRAGGTLAADEDPAPGAVDELRGRALRVLRRFGCRTSADVARLTSDDLRMARDCGGVTIQEIRHWLASHGLSLADERPAM